MLSDADIVAERRALEAAARAAEAESIRGRLTSSVRRANRVGEPAATGPRKGPLIGERDRTRLTPEQWRQLGLGQCVIEWIDNEGDHWAHGDSDGVWTRAMGLPIDVPVWVNGYRLTRLSPAELQGLADRIARGEE